MDELVEVKLFVDCIGIENKVGILVGIMVGLSNTILAVGALVILLLTVVATLGATVGLLVGTSLEAIVGLLVRLLVGAFVFIDCCTDSMDELVEVKLFVDCIGIENKVGILVGIMIGLLLGSQDFGVQESPSIAVPPAAKQLH